MSLINCSECGKEISSEAINCPNCGYPLNKLKKQSIMKTENMMSRFKVLSIVFGAFLLVDLLIFLVFANWFWTNGEKYEFEKSDKYTTQIANEIGRTYSYKTFDEDLIKEGDKVKKLKNISLVILVVFIILFLIFIILYKSYKQRYENYKILKENK